MLSQLDDDRDEALCASLQRLSGYTVTPDLVSIEAGTGENIIFTPNEAGQPTLGGGRCTVGHTRVAFASLVTAWGRPRMPMRLYNTAAEFKAEWLETNGFQLDDTDILNITFPLSLGNVTVGSIHKYAIPSTSRAFTGTLEFSVFRSELNTLRYTIDMPNGATSSTWFPVGLIVNTDNAGTGVYIIRIDGRPSPTSTVGNVLYVTTIPSLTFGTHEIRIDSSATIYTAGPEGSYLTYALNGIVEITRHVWAETDQYWVGTPEGDSTRVTVNKDVYANNPVQPRLKNPFRGVGITTLPAGLFNNCIIEDTDGFLRHTGLTTIPTGLFEGATVRGAFDHAYPTTTKTVETGVLPTPSAITSIVGLLEGSAITGLPGDIISPYSATLTSAREAFANTTLSQLPLGMFNGCTQLTDVASLCENCTALRLIPDYLFRDALRLTDASRLCYMAAGLSAIPKDIFKDLTALTTIEEAFYGAGSAVVDGDYGSFTQTMVQNCSSLVNGHAAFAGCPFTNIGLAPFKDLVAVEDLSYFFAKIPDIASRAKIGSLTQDMFVACKALRDLRYFMWGTGLSMIVQNPIAYIPTVSTITSFEGMFGYTALTRLPEGLFDAATSLQSLSRTFEGCEQLTDVPDNLLTVVGQTLTDVSYLFAKSGVTTMPSNFLATAVSLTTTASMYEDSALKSIGTTQTIPSTSLTTLDNMFAGTAITAYPDIPIGQAPSASYAGTFARSQLASTQGAWFTKHTTLTSLEETFAGSALATLVTGTFPSTVSKANMQRMCKGLTSQGLRFEPGWLVPGTEAINLTEAFYGAPITQAWPAGVFPLTTRMSCNKMFYELQNPTGAEIATAWFETLFDTEKGGPVRYNLTFGGDTQPGDYNARMAGDGRKVATNMGLYSSSVRTLFGTNPKVTGA